MTTQEPAYNCAIIRFVQSWHRAADQQAGAARWTPPPSHTAVHPAAATGRPRRCTRTGTKRSS